MGQCKSTDHREGRASDPQADAVFQNHSNFTIEVEAVLTFDIILIFFVEIQARRIESGDILERLPSHAFPNSESGTEVR